MNLIKSKQRVAEHGEVFTPPWMVDAMLDLVKNETERITARFLEPACGSGNFLVPVVKRKLAAVEREYGGSEFGRRHYALWALMCVYGIELLRDNIDECHANLLDVFAKTLNLDKDDDLYRAASYVLTINLVHGDARLLLTDDGRAITFAEWGYLGKGKYKRRDFRLSRLGEVANFKADAATFGPDGGHMVFTPVQDYPRITMKQLADNATRSERLPQ